MSSNKRRSNLAQGYEHYRESLISVPKLEYGYASSDDLSSDWDESDPQTNDKPKPSAWKKVRNAVHWTPFIQTYKRNKYPWVQLAGHTGNFASGETQGTILKKLGGSEEECFQKLIDDVLRPFVPECKRTIIKEGETYLELQDLLSNFDTPCIMDIKMGVRTYLEDELAKAREKPKLRKDMYEKMIQIDPSEPNEEECNMKAVTKTRYMIWRETISSTASLGFRIEGFKLSNGKTSKDFKRTKTEEQTMAAFKKFFEFHPNTVKMYLEKLNSIKQILEISPFFKSHELIGSSLLFVHDDTKADIWLIDFAKTYPLPNGITISHRSEWKVGNHEDGYLIGLDSLIRIFSNM